MTNWTENQMSSDVTHKKENVLRGRLILLKLYKSSSRIEVSGGCQIVELMK